MSGFKDEGGLVWFSSSRRKNRLLYVVEGGKVDLFYFSNLNYKFWPNHLLAQSHGSTIVFYLWTELEPPVGASVEKIIRRGSWDLHSPNHSIGARAPPAPPLNPPLNPTIFFYLAFQLEVNRCGQIHVQNEQWWERKQAKKHHYHRSLESSTMVMFFVAYHQIVVDDVASRYLLWHLLLLRLLAKWSAIKWNIGHLAE